MKLVAILFSLLLISNISFAKSGEVKKVADGGIATCNTETDALLFKSAFKVTTKSIEVIDGQVVAEMQALFLKCKIIGEGDYGFVTVSPYDVVKRYFPVNKDIVKIVTETPEEVYVKAYVPGVFDIISNVQLGDVNGAQNFTVQASLESLVTASQMDDYSRGESVKASFDVFIYKLVTWKDMYSDETSDGEESSSSFRVSIDLKK